MKRFLQAKGRLKVGEMNRTEAAYRDHLEQQKNAGLKKNRSAPKDANEKSSETR